MNAPGSRADQLEELVIVGPAPGDTAKKGQFEFMLSCQGIEGADESVLIFPQADQSDAQNARRLVRWRGGIDIKEGGIDSIRDDPGLAGQWAHGGLRIVGDANHSKGARNGNGLQPRGEPVK